jgi:hypothetical protein
MGRRLSLLEPGPVFTSPDADPYETIHEKLAASYLGNVAPSSPAEAALALLAGALSIIRVEHELSDSALTPSACGVAARSVAATTAAIVMREGMSYAGQIGFGS